MQKGGKQAVSSVEKMPPLTAEEQKMAEDYYYLVDEFLHRKRLDSNEYFDVVIFGYLQAIQRECRNPNPPEKKNFHGLVEVCMKRAVFQEWRYKGCEMREADRLALSLDGIPAGTDNEDFSMYEIVADVRQNTAIQVEASDLIDRVLAVATPRERETIDLACLGYEPYEIAEMLGITQNTTYRILCNFRAKAKAVRDDRDVIRSPQWARDKEKIQARNRAYQQAHRLELNAKARIRDRAYRAAHPEEVRAKERAYRAAHKDEINARERARRAAKRAVKQAQEQEKRRPQCSEHQERQVAVAV